MKYGKKKNYHIKFWLTLFIIIGCISFVMITWPQQSMRFIQNHFGTKKDSTSVVDTAKVEPDVTMQSPLDTIRIPLVVEGRTAYLITRVNDVPIRFILDTGCSDVQISRTEYAFLLKNGFIKGTTLDEDSVVTVNADGFEHTKAVVTVDSLSVGNIIVHGVKVFIGRSVESPNLLGQSVLGELGTLLLNYGENELIIIRKNEDRNRNKIPERNSPRD